MFFLLASPLAFFYAFRRSALLGLWFIINSNFNADFYRNSRNRVGFDFGFDSGNLISAGFLAFDGFKFQLVQKERGLALDGDFDVVIILDLAQLTFLAVQQVIGHFQRQAAVYLGDVALGGGAVHLAQEGERHGLD